MGSFFIYFFSIWKLWSSVLCQKRTQLNRKVFHKLPDVNNMWFFVIKSTKSVSFDLKQPDIERLNSRQNKWTIEPSITCSYIWHVNISKYVYWLYAQFVKVCSRCNTSDINSRELCAKFLKKRNKIKWHSPNSHILWKFSKNMCSQTQMPFIFVIFFSDIWQYCRPIQQNSLENQKSVS